MITLSVLTKPNGVLTKKISCVNGVVQSDSSECRISSALATRHTIDFEQFPTLLKSLKTNQCITTGWVDCANHEVELMPRDKFDAKSFAYPAQELPHGTYATRTLDSFTQAGPSLVMFDYDDDSSSPFRIDSPEQFIQALTSVIPNFNQIRFVRTYSTSSAIYDKNGHCLKPASGFHIYMEIEDGTDLMRFGQVLEKRLWLAGLGYIKVSSKSANLMTRTLVDTAVFSPERLAFEAGAVVTDPNIYQQLPEPEFYNRPLRSLNTRLVADLTPEEEKQYLDTIQATRLSPNVKAIQDKVKKEIAQDIIVKAQVQGRIIVESQAMRMVENLERQILSPFHIIHFEDGTQATVFEIVVNPLMYDGKECLDPLREDKGFGRAKVYANVDQAVPRPVIHSFVEGERNFDLLQSLRSLHSKTQDEEFQALKEMVTSYETQNSRYFQPIQIQTGINLLKAEKGVGKTSAVSEVIKETELSVLGITPRIGLTQTLSKNFNLACYNESDMTEAHVLRSQKRLAICYDSLYKIAGQQYDIVVCDEIIQLMRHVKSSSVRKKFICLNVLRSLILNAKYVIMMDADISVDYLGLLKDPKFGCCKANMDIRLIYNTYKPAEVQQRKVFNFVDDEKKGDEVSWTLDLIEYARHKGVFVASNSRKHTYLLVNEILKDWGQDVVLEEGHFMSEVNGRRIITITSDNSGQKDVSEFVKNINQELKESDIFIASPSLGTGVSIDERNNEPVFKRVYFRFTKRAGNTSADCSQHIARIRGCTVFHGVMIDTKQAYETEPDKIVDQQVNAFVNSMDRKTVRWTDLNFDPYLRRYVFADQNWSTWFGQMVSFENIDKNHFVENFITRLVNEGYAVEDREIYIDRDTRLKQKETSKKIKEDQNDLEVELTVDAPLISDEEKAELEKKTQLDVEEKRKMLKRQTADAFGEYNQDALAGLLRLSKAALKYRRTGLMFGMPTETLLLIDLANRLDTEKMHIEKTVYYAKQQLMFQIAACVGVTFTEEGQPVSNHAPINESVKAALYNILKENADDVKLMFGVNVGYHTTSQAIATVIGNVLKAIGLKTVRKNFNVPSGTMKIPTICVISLDQLWYDIKRAKANSPDKYHKVMQESPHSLSNFIAQYIAGTPEKAMREYRYLQQMNPTEMGIFNGFVQRIAEQNGA